MFVLALIAIAAVAAAPLVALVRSSRRSPDPRFEEAFTWAGVVLATVVLLFGMAGGKPGPLYLAAALALASCARTYFVCRSAARVHVPA